MLLVADISTHPHFLFIIAPAVRDSQFEITLFLLNATAKEDSKVIHAAKTSADENSGMRTVMFTVALLVALFPARPTTVSFTA